MMAFSMTLTDP